MQGVGNIINKKTITMQTYFCQNMVFLAILSLPFPQKHVQNNKINIITDNAVSDTEGAENFYFFMLS